MKKFQKKFFIFSPLLAIGVAIAWHFGAAHAAFNANDIIDDGVFNNTTSMSAAQIDSWLNNNFPSSCISTNNGFASADPIGYNPTQGFIYGGPVSAGKVIYDAAQAYGINPQVLLATLQKEEVLVTGTSGCATWQYTSAMGFSCTDSQHLHSYPAEGALLTPLYYKSGVAVTSISNTCVGNFDGTAGPQYAGFSEQVIWAAWLLEKGLQRSEGNVNWMVIKPNWDNSDESNCYSGPMTQGYLKRCRTDTSAVYYDGYVTIDGQSVHMDTGATATLYWYTPHFSGNQSFYNLFTGWFGSTQFPQPVGGRMYYQVSTGDIFLVTTSDNTRYYIPSWSILQNYGLDVYPTQSIDDTSLQQFTDGGSLTNLVWQPSGVYLTNNKALYHVGGSSCTDWGLDCFNSAAVKGLSADFISGNLISGGELPPLSSYNFVVYKLSGGQRQPLAGPQTMVDLGYNWSQVLAVNSTNNTQPLGALLLTSPSFIAFAPSPDIYYYDGQLYHHIASPDVFNAWGLDKKPVMSPPTSSYNSAPPALDQDLNIWVQINSTRYLIDGGRKISLDTTQQQLWPTAQYQTFSASAAGALPDASLQTYAWANPDFYKLGNSQKRHITTTEDLTLLGVNSTNTQSLSHYSVSLIPDGNLAFGTKALLRSSADSKIYVISGDSRFYVPDPSTFTSFGFDWGKVRTYSDSDMAGYPLAGNLQQTVKTSQGYSFIYKGTRVAISGAQVTEYGLTSASYQTLADGVIVNATQTKNMTAFIRNDDNGAIYYASGGALHYVTSNNSFIAYGGQRIPMTFGNTAFVNSFALAQPI